MTSKDYIICPHCKIEIIPCPETCSVYGNEVCRTGSEFKTVCPVCKKTIYGFMEVGIKYRTRKKE